MVNPFLAFSSLAFIPSLRPKSLSFWKLSTLGNLGRNTMFHLSRDLPSTSFCTALWYLVTAPEKQAFTVRPRAGSFVWDPLACLLRLCSGVVQECLKNTSVASVLSGMSSISRKVDKL